MRWSVPEGMHQQRHLLASMLLVPNEYNGRPTSDGCLALCTQVADATAAVKERLAYYLKKQEEAKANPENGAADFEADGEAADKADAPPKAAAAAQPRAQAQQAPYVGGDEPTPAEAAGGRAPAPEDGPPAQNGSAQSAQGAWASGDAAAAPATEPEAGTAGGGVSVGLLHSEDGSVSVKLTVSEEQ